ncbi:MAG: hypothetical protein K5849_03790 [Bacteroidales bacterium]|nr:hypothetical protein [Bacteroidales bacterium]
MASISDLIMQQVRSMTNGVQIPANAQSQVLNGLSSSVLGSLTQTVARPGGAEMLKSLFTGKSDVASSPVTELAGNLFSTNILSKLNLGSALNGTLSGLVPKIMGSLSNVIRDRDGDGDVDINDILLSLRGGSGNSILSAATSILGGILKKK